MIVRKVTSIQLLQIAADTHDEAAMVIGELLTMVKDRGPAIQQTGWAIVDKLQKQAESLRGVK